MKVERFELKDERKIQTKLKTEKRVGVWKNTLSFHTSINQRCDELWLF